ncbi:hypothetical protein OESDEN_00448 [Oesophagostomum dentatum]|uniref:Uncharacterized protein n=1 Tax=Oesophagostomum dentatum TaxID=61180 RepID=A0A0B1TTV6_OESDE|nr:hypothetical protein OESDEN_00448 [Oesophagostomum dentatum]
MHGIRRFEKETDTEQFSTKFDDEDGPDVFVFFKQTMEQFERREPELFSVMVGNLAPEVAESLQNLIKVTRFAFLFDGLSHVLCVN